MFDKKKRATKSVYFARYYSKDRLAHALLVKRTSIKHNNELMSLDHLIIREYDEENVLV